MTVLRLISCDITGCEEKLLEEEPGKGWPRWGTLQGVQLNGIANPCLCPSHLEKASDFVDRLGARR